MSIPASDQRIITTLAMIADTSNTTLEVLERMDIAQQTGIALTEAILETLKKNGGGAGGGGGMFGGMASSMKNMGISSLKDMKDAAEIIPKLASAILKFKLLAGNKAQSDVIDFIKRFREAVAGTSESKTDFEKFGIGFTAVASSLSKMAVSMLLFRTLAGDKTQDVTIGFIKNFVTAFGEIDMGKIQTGGDALSQIASSLALLAVSLIATSALMIVAAPLATLILIPVLAAMSLVFGLVGKYGPDIEKGALAIAVMSVSLAMFALTMYAVSSMDSMSISNVLQISASIAIVALVFGIVGLVAADVALGGGAMLIVALSLVVIAAGLAIYKSTKFTMEDTGILGVVLTTLGTLFAFAGLISPAIAAGGLAMVIVGVSLIFLSAGLAFYRMINFKKEDIENLKFLVTGIGESFGAVGKQGYADILSGAIGLAAAGISLIFFSAGLWVYRKMEFKPQDSDNLKKLITDVAVSFSSIGVIGSVQMLAGAAALAAAGVSLIAFSAGLWVYRKMEFKAQDSANLKSLVEDVSTAFTSIGVIGSIKMAAGSVALIAAGVAIVGISAAIWAFRKVDFTESDRKKMVDVLTVVTSTFKDIYENNSDSVKKGIAAVKDAGSVLFDLAKGVQAFASLNFIDPVTKKAVMLTPADLVRVGVNIGLVLSAVSDGFAAVGKTDDAGYFTVGFVGKGIKAVKGMGAELSQIAAGIQAFALGNFSDGKGGSVNLTQSSFDQVKNNIVSMITALGSTFASIGEGELGGSEGGLKGGFKKVMNFVAGGNIQRGLMAVRGIGAEILPIAQAVQMFVNTKFNPETAVGIGQGIADMINRLMNIQVDPVKSAGLHRVGRFLTSIATLQKPLEAVNNSIKGIVGSMERLYASIAKVSEKSMENASHVLQSIAALSTTNAPSYMSTPEFAKNLLNYSITKTGQENVKQIAAVAQPAVKTLDPAPASKVTPPGEMKTRVVRAPQVDNQASDMMDSITSLNAAIGGLSASMNKIVSLLSGTIKVSDAALAVKY